MLVRLEFPTEQNVTTLCSILSGRTDLGNKVTFVLDYGKQGAGFHALELHIKSLINIIETYCSNASVAISASSFPDGFTSITTQKIYERISFEAISKSVQGPLIYSDRGSARAEKQQGGGGLPAPRIDYPKKNEWFFFRQSLPSGTAFDGYQTQALAALRSSAWDKGLKLWGCQMIERTAGGDSQTGISSPNRSTAVRINLHLHRQMYYSDEASFFATDEEWTD
jgi:hypothetical protein